MKKVSMNDGVVNRRKNVIERLENQLNSGVKPDTSSDNKFTRATTGMSYIPLTDDDKDRIKKELKTLKLRVHN